MQTIPRQCLGAPPCNGGATLARSAGAWSRNDCAKMIPALPGVTRARPGPERCVDPRPHPRGSAHRLRSRGRPVPPGEGARHGRHGLRRVRHPGRPGTVGPARRHQVHAAGRDAVAVAAPALRARGGGDRPPAQRARVPASRCRSPAGRRALHGHGVPGRLRPRARDRGSRAAAAVGGGRLRAPDRGRDGRGAQPWHRAPRPQAGQRLSRVDPGRLVGHQGPGLRRGQGGRRHAQHGDQHGHGLAVVHGPRAARLGQAGRRAGRRLLDRRRPVLPADGQGALRRRCAARAVPHGPQRGPGASVGAPPRSTSPRSTTSSSPAWRGIRPTASRTSSSWRTRCFRSRPSTAGPWPRLRPWRCGSCRAAGGRLAALSRPAPSPSACASRIHPPTATPRSWSASRRPARRRRRRGRPGSGGGRSGSEGPRAWPWASPRPRC